MSKSQIKVFLFFFVLIIFSLAVLFVIFFGSNFLDLVDFTPSLPAITSYPIPNRTYTDSIYLSGKYLYVGGFSSEKNAPVLEIIDISTISSPNEVGSFLFNPSIFVGDLIKDIYVSEKYAYVALKSKGIAIIDISNPSSPYEIGFHNFPQCDISKVIVQEDYLYALICSDFKIIDVSNPSLPKEVGNYSFEKDSLLRDMDLKNNYAYIATNKKKGDTIEIIDISNPPSPNKTGAYTPDKDLVYGTINNISTDIDGKYAYITRKSKNAWLEIIDISNHSSLIKSAELKLPRGFSAVQEMKISKNYVYIAHGTRGVRVIDISDPLSPKEIARSISNGISVRNLAIGEGYIFVVKPDNLEIVDVSNIPKK